MLEKEGAVINLSEEGANNRNAYLVSYNQVDVTSGDTPELDDTDAPAQVPGSFRD